MTFNVTREASPFSGEFRTPRNGDFFPHWQEVLFNREKASVESFKELQHQLWNIEGRCQEVVRYVWYV